MSKYFKFFPKAQYKFANSTFSIQKTISNITLKTVLRDSLSQDDPYLYLRYTVREGERAEDVSNFYYDDPGLVWLIYFANDIIDPYTQWPMDYPDFTSYFRKKYAEQALPTDVDPIEWGQNTLRTDNIVHYKNVADDTILLSTDSYTRAQTFDSEFLDYAFTEPISISERKDFLAEEWKIVEYTRCIYNLHFPI